MNDRHSATTRILSVDSDLKQIAWLYGHAEKGSPQEEDARKSLMLKIAQLNSPETEHDEWGDAPKPTDTWSQGDEDAYGDWDENERSLCELLQRSRRWDIRTEGPEDWTVFPRYVRGCMGTGSTLLEAVQESCTRMERKDARYGRLPLNTPAPDGS